MIRIEHLRKEYSNVTPLKDVTVTINDGDVISVIGPSGTGKSTFIRCLNLLEKPTSGEIWVDDICITDKKCNINKVRQKMGMVFQSFNLFNHMTVIKNIMAAPMNLLKKSKEEAYEEGMQLLRAVGLADKALNYPDELSGGQKQRVAIARALATDPQLLLCDEATSALDPQTTGSILELIREINEKLGITVVIITHQMSVVTDICKKVAIIDNGRLVEEGLVEEIFSAPKSDAARELLSGKKVSYKPLEKLEEGRRIRIVFRENSAYEPVIANLILKLQIPINILKAETQNVGGRAVGEMILGLPDNSNQQEDIILELKNAGLTVTEVHENE